MREKLIRLYGPTQGNRCYTRLRQRLDAFRAAHPELVRPIEPSERVTERDVMLITYGDTLFAPHEPPLHTLHRFLTHHLHDVLSAVHILPFFPYTSDYGFSVKDYRAVNPTLGTWEDIRRLGRDFKLMFDAVINHISTESDWFQGFLAGDRHYQDYFITVDPGADLSDVVRPRASPLLTPFETASGTRYVWTTFSPDQVDLNFANPDVLLDIIDVLLWYISQGMAFIRLDAIAYLWKIVGTPCIHLEQTHLVVQLLRDVFDYVAPYITIITETNVPHAENVSYFGAGTNEAQLVYQFTLPPLILHAITSGKATTLSEWAASLEKPSDSTAFFNFTASHDGIGLRPAEGILSDAEVNQLVERAKAHGGDAKLRRLPDGSTKPYELNLNYFDALSDPAAGEPVEHQVRRFMVSQAIQMAFIGVPGIYIHSILGSRNWPEGVTLMGDGRGINREKLPVDQVETELAETGSRRQQVMAVYRQLLTCRIQETAFHPNGPQQVLALDPAVFALLRTSPDGTEHVVAIHNVADHPITLDLTGIPLPSVHSYTDLLTGQRVEAGSPCHVDSYQITWLKAEQE